MGRANPLVLKRVRRSADHCQVDHLDDVFAALACSEVRLLAFDVTGGHSVPVPPELPVDPACVLDDATPLGPLMPESHGSAVAAFERARRTGRGTATVVMRGDDEQRYLDIFDLRPEHDCFLAVMGSAPAAVAPADEESSALRPYRCLFTMSATGVVETVSEEFSAMLGWAPEEIIGRSSLEIIHPDEHELGIVVWCELLEQTGTQRRLRQRFATADGGWLWCEVTDSNHLDHDEPHMQAELLDVSREMAAQAALQEREALLHRLTQALPTGVLHVDDDGNTLVSNDRWSELTGIDSALGLGPLVDAVVERNEVAEAIERSRTEGADTQVEVEFRPGTGAACRFGELRLRPLRIDHRSSGLLVALDDVSNLRTHQQELDERSRRDPLTGLYNRFAIEEILAERMAASAGPLVRRGPVVLFVDLDRFKSVNDTFGHAVGDEVLCAIADAIGAALRSPDALGRVGGDEFLFVIDEGDTSLGDALAERISEAVNEVDVEFRRRLGDEFGIGVSIGVAEAYPHDDPGSLMHRADLCMYREKRGRSTGR